MKKILLSSVVFLHLLFSGMAFAQDDAVGTAIGGTFGIGILCCQGIFFIIAIAGLVFWVLMLVDVIKRQDDQFPNPSENTKIIWILIVVLLSWIGALVYYFMVKKKMPI